MTRDDAPQKIAILGAGIMGLSAGFMLKSAPDSSYDVVIYDGAGFPPMNASAVAGGMLAPFSEADYLPQSYHATAQSSIGVWTEMFAELGTPELLSTEGSLILAHNADQHMMTRFTDHLPENTNFQTVAPQEIEPAIPQDFAQGHFIEGEGHLDPKATLRKLIEYLYVARTTFEHQHKEPEELADIYDFVIDARGIRAKKGAKKSAKKSLGNLRGVKGEILSVRNPDFTLSRPVRLMHPRYPLYIIPRDDHVFTVGATIIESQDSEKVSVKSEMELLSALYTLHPSFGEADIIESHARIRPAFEDNVPQIIRDENIIHANGLFRHGYLFAPVMGRSIVAMIEGRTDENLEIFERGKYDTDHHQRHRKTT